MSLSQSTLRQLPKIDLHRHLEGTLRLETLVEIARKHDIAIPERDAATLRPLVKVTDDIPDFLNFLSKFKILRHFYRSPELIKRITREAIADAAAENIKYLELRFSPQALAYCQEYALEDVTDWVISAARSAQAEMDIEVGLIVTLLRHEPKLARSVTAIALERSNDGIVGIDLAGDEINYSARPFTELFDRARLAGLGTTVHAGERNGAHEVAFALNELGADRIGHGVRAIESSRVVNRLRRSGNLIEICLTSNLQTGAIAAMRQHPLSRLLSEGINVALASDDPQVSDITLVDEYQLATDTLGLTYSDLREMTLAAARAAFLPPEGREQLIASMMAQWPEPKGAGATAHSPQTFASIRL